MGVCGCGGGGGGGGEEGGGVVKLPTVCQVQGINHLIGPGLDSYCPTGARGLSLKVLLGCGGGRVGSGWGGGGVWGAYSCAYRWL